MGFLPVAVIACPTRLPRVKIDPVLRKFTCLLLVALLLILEGCAPQAAPDLLELDTIGPATLEAGSEIRIEGHGFPDNRPGTLTFTGTVHAPARAPQALSWSLPVVAESTSSVAVPITHRQLDEQLEGAHHVTFRGSAELSFAPVIEGRPILRGTRSDLVLDLFSSSKPPESELAQFLTYLGIELNDSLVVTEMMAESKAAESGLQVGDRLHTLDGVRLDSPADFLPQAHAQASVIQYSRAGFQGRAEAHLSRADFQILDHTLAARGLAALCAVVLALLWAARPPRFLVWLFSARTPRRKGRILWMPGIAAGRQWAAYPVFLGAVLLYFFLLAGWETSLSELDFIACLAGGCTLLMLASFLLGGMRGNGGFSLLGALSATALRTLLVIPIVIASLAHASHIGTLRLGDLASAQQALPPHWGLFQSPWTFLLSLGYLLALIPLAGRRAPLEGHPGPEGQTVLLSRTTEWAGHVLLLGLWVVLFGGASRGGESFWWAGALLSGKLALLAHLVGWVRARTGGLRLGESWSLYGGANLILSLLCCAMSVGALALGLEEAHTGLLGYFAATLATSLAVLFLISSQRSWAHMGRRIDPWI